MSRTLLILSSLAALAGCYNEDKFAEDYSVAYCDRMTACQTDIVDAYVAMGLDEATAQSTYDTAYAAACETEAEEGEDDGDDTCEFDGDAAQTCVSEVEALSCEFWSTGTGFPESCGQTCG